MNDSVDVLRWPWDFIAVVVIVILAISWAEWKQRRSDRAERLDLEARRKARAFLRDL